MNTEGIISLVLAILMLGCGCVSKSSMDVDFQKKVLSGINEVRYDNVKVYRF